MANRKLSEHTAITGANVNPNADYIEMLDVSDTTDAASGTNKKILPSQLLIAIGAEPAKGADDNYVTNAEKVVIGNTSGTNTGDNAVNSNYSGLAASISAEATTRATDDTTLAGLITTEASTRSTADTTLQTNIDNKVTKNANITPATKTKVTYDVKGLVTSGADATTADIADSTNKRYVTDADLVDIGNLSGINTGDQDLSSYATKTGAETITNKRLTARVQSVTSSATVTPNADNDDLVIITAQAASLIIANPTGTPTEGQALLIRIKDNGTASAVSFGSEYRAIGITLPTTTVLSKTMYLGCVRNATDTKWDVIGLSQEA